MHGRMFCPYKTIILKKGGLMLILESVIGKCLWSRLYVIV